MCAALRPYIVILAGYENELFCILVTLTGIYAEVNSDYYDMLDGYTPQTQQDDKDSEEPTPLVGLLSPS